MTNEACNYAGALTTIHGEYLASTKIIAIRLLMTNEACNYLLLTEESTPLSAAQVWTEVFVMVFTDTRILSIREQLAKTAHLSAEGQASYSLAILSSLSSLKVRLEVAGRQACSKAERRLSESSLELLVLLALNCCLGMHREPGSSR